MPEQNLMGELKPPLKGIDFEALPWNMNASDKSMMVYVHMSKGGAEGTWSEEHYDSKTDTALPLTPANTSLNYGTTVWEGIKAFRTIKGRCMVFRPDRNALRMQHGAKRMKLPVPPFELFMRGVQTAVQENSELVPPCIEGTKLYIRPILFGHGQQLGLYPSPEFGLVFYAAPTGNYFKSASGGIKLCIEKNYCRAAPGGTGNVKIAGNYGITLAPLAEAKANGFADCVYLELDTYLTAKAKAKDLLHPNSKTALRSAVLQEMSAANLFLVQKEKKRILTPSLDRGTILPGVTRDSVIQIVRDEEYNREISKSLGLADGERVEMVEAGDVTVADLEDCEECFATGTAAELVPIWMFSEYLTDEEKAAGAEEQQIWSVTMPQGEHKEGHTCRCILNILREIMNETRPDKFGWLRDAFAGAAEFRGHAPGSGSVRGKAAAFEVNKAESNGDVGANNSNANENAVKAQ